jgi:hypothetical protein
MGRSRVTDNLAWRKNLSKTRAVMKISAPTRTHCHLERGRPNPRLGHSARGRPNPRLGFGQRANNRLFCAAIAVGACFALACGDDDPAEPTGIGGSSSSGELDASVRDLPGDGRETTPEFDIESRQRTPIGPQRIVENIDEIRDDFGLGYGGNGATDAGAADAADGGAD